MSQNPDTEYAPVKELQPMMPDAMHFTPLEQLELQLQTGLQVVDGVVLKSYLPSLSNLDIVKPSEAFDKNTFKDNDFYFLQITRMVYEKNEFSITKFATIFQALSTISCTLCMVIQQKDGVNAFYLGVRGEDKYRSDACRKLLKETISGHFPGSQTEIIRSKVGFDRSCINSIASVTAAADYKTEKVPGKKEDFFQGLENFINSKINEDYTAILLAESVSFDVLEKTRHSYEDIYSLISPFANMQYQYSQNQTGTQTTGESQNQNINLQKNVANAVGNTENKGVSTADGTNHTANSAIAKTEGKSETVNWGHTDSESQNITENQSETKGGSANINFGLQTGNGYTEGRSENTSRQGNILQSLGKAIFGGNNQSNGVNFAINQFISGTLSANASIQKSKTTGISEGETTGSADTKGGGETKNQSETVTKGDSFGTTRTETKTSGTSKSHTTTVGSTIGQSFGLTNSESFSNAFGTTQGTTLNARNMTLQNMMKRLEKQMERIEICESSGMWNFSAYFLADNTTTVHNLANSYYSLITGKKSGLERSAVNLWDTERKVQQLCDYLDYYQKPLFLLDQVPVDATTLISTNELALSIAPPRKSVNGLPVTEHAVFGQEVVRNAEERAEDHRSIQLGNIYHLNQEMNTNVKLDLESLAMHTFVTGSTGSGKSNTVYQMIAELRKKRVHYLIVEPAKGEYRYNVEGTVYGTNPKRDKLLRLDPFSFPPEIHVLEHIDKLTELFNVCWPMYAAMPAVLKDSIIRAYQSCGWDMEFSENQFSDRLFPNFKDVLRELETVVQEAQYSTETSSDYKGALKTRLKSLTNGINGLIFVNDELRAEDLFDSNVIADLSRVGSMETKALLMGVLVLKLQEYRMSCHGSANESLQHVTVLEEAHNLLKKTSTEQTQEGANLQGKSVEMLTNAIAEMRTYGEGFIIVDQAPDLLDTAVIRNTNTKILLRLPEKNDRDISGSSESLKEEQITELAKLPTGVAAVYQNNWQEAVLCQMKKHKAPGQKLQNKPDEKLNALRERNHGILRTLFHQEPLDLEQLLLSNVCGKIKRQLMDCDVRDTMYPWLVSDFIKEAYPLDHPFELVKKCNINDDTELIAQKMERNASELYKCFSEQELKEVLYYLCFYLAQLCADEKKSNEEQEKIIAVRDDYFKKAVKL